MIPGISSTTLEFNEWIWQHRQLTCPVMTSPSGGSAEDRLVDQRFDTSASLSFPSSGDADAEDADLAGGGAPLLCLCCDSELENADRLAEHLLSVHRLVVADIALVADLGAYCQYWSPRLRAAGGMQEFCFTVLTNTAPGDGAPSEEYFLLSPKLEEDRVLRERLQRVRLERVLARQQRERTMTYTRGCLFCRLQYSGRLAGYFDHLAEDHNFSVGRPDNIVFGPEFIDAIEAKLEALRCLFCDGEFPDRATLKEHMRKKQHKMINPAHTVFDRFYVINYLEFGKGWQEIQQERDEGLPTGFDEPGSDDEWSDWQEAPSSGAVCLFCQFSTVDTDALSEHMRAEHQFDFPETKSRLRLSFYQQVKLVNYIRRQMVERACLFCQETLPTRETLLEHLRAADHLRVPEPSVWDQPQYFFPTYENDSLLYALEEADGAADDVPVFPEDAPDVRNSVLADSAVREELGGHA